MYNQSRLRLYLSLFAFNDCAFICQFDSLLETSSNNFSLGKTSNKILFFIVFSKLSVSSKEGVWAKHELHVTLGINRVAKLIVMSFSVIFCMYCCRDAQHVGRVLLLGLRVPSGGARRNCQMVKIKKYIYKAKYLYILMCSRIHIDNNLQIKMHNFITQLHLNITTLEMKR